MRSILDTTSYTHADWGRCLTRVQERATTKDVASCHALDKNNFSANLREHSRAKHIACPTQVFCPVFSFVQRNRKKQKESTRKIALKRKERQKKEELRLKAEKEGVVRAAESNDFNGDSNRREHPTQEEDYHDDRCEYKRGNMNLLGKLFAYFTSTITTTFYVTVGYFVCIYFVIKQGYFDSVLTENGVEFYAEKPHPKLHELFPTLKLPMNTLVNIGYLNVGLIVIAHAQKLLMNKKLTESDAAMFFIFGWSGFLYGHVQFWRIILQQQHQSVMDQWVTLPIFAWIVCWTCHIYYGWSFVRNLVITAVSTASYCLTWYDRNGFDIILGIHISCAIFYGSMLYWNTSSKKAKRDFWIAILLCAGFVVLKLLDLHLPEYHPIFTTFSGHFLSKICDFLQMYFVAKFFMHVNLAANKRKLKAKED